MTTPKLRRIERDRLSPWITVKEAANYLGVSADTIYDACAGRGLRHVKLGHSTIRLRWEWLDEWLTTQVKQRLPPALKEG